MSYKSALAALVESRIGVRMRFLGSADPVLRHVRERVASLSLGSAEEFVDRIAQSSTMDPEYRLLVRAVTNGQTFFFRDEEQLVGLVDFIGERSRATGGRTTQIWSAACATGEEPYSLAMIAMERGIDVRILATDVNDARIDFASHGRYEAFALRHVPPAFRERYFDQVGSHFVVKPIIRSRVDFVCHNLLTPDLPIQMGRPSLWDVIVCRNLFIYLSPETVTDVVRRMSTGLARDGILCLGTAESLRGHDVPLVPFHAGSRMAYRHRRDKEVVPSSGTYELDLHETKTSDSRIERATVIESPEARAITALRDGRLVDAESRLRDLVMSAPDRWDLRLSLGHVYLRSHRLPLAMQEYSRAQATADLESEPSFFVGLAALKAESLEEARVALRRSLFLDESNFRTALLLAGVLERQREHSQATRMLGHARKVAASPRVQDGFRSCVVGISAATISVDQARASIETRLSALNRKFEA